MVEGDFKSDVDPEVFARFFIPAYTGIQLVSDAFTGREDLLLRIRELWIFILPGVIPEDRLESSRDLLDRLIPYQASKHLLTRQ